MSHIRKRVLPSGKIRWTLTWGKPRKTKDFGTQRQALAHKAIIDSARPASDKPVSVMMDAFKTHFESLVDNGDRERSSLAQIRQHIDLHVMADQEFANLRCCDLDTPELQQLFDRIKCNVSTALAVKIRGTVSRACAFGVRRGFLTTNPVDNTKIERSERHNGKSVEPFVLPAKDNLRALIAAAKRRHNDDKGRAIATVRVLMFGGLRISELRGLPRSACFLIGNDQRIDIVQRADRYDEIGPPKSAAGRRTIHLGSETTQDLRVWLMAAPKPKPRKTDDVDALPRHELAFPNEDGRVWGYSNFWNRFWVPLMNEAGLIENAPASKIVRTWSKAHAEYRQPAFGPHMLRHVYASLQIERGVTPKRLQKLMGHATLKMTLDTYGHLWPDDEADLARARGVETAI